MKNLANCTPTEFVQQTNLIRKSVENWFDVTDIMNIRKRTPKNLPEVSKDMSEDEILKVNSERKKMLNEQAKKNLHDILIETLDKHPKETLEVFALCCFVDPKDVDSHTIKEYLDSIMDMIEDDSVVRFFTLLAKLGQKSTSIQ